MQIAAGIPQDQIRATELQPLPVLIVSSVALLVIGVVMISSASMDMAAATLNNSYHYVIRQLIFAALGCLTALIAVNVPVSWWERSGWLLLAIGMLVLVAVRSEEHTSELQSREN